MNDTSKTYTVLELLCVFFWFLLDGFWLMEWRVAAYAFSALALATAGLMFFFIKHELTLILVACADASWLLCNITWAIGDLSHLPSSLMAAKIIFFIGLALCLCAFYTTDSRKTLSTLILGRLRIMKFFEREHAHR